MAKFYMTPIFFRDHTEMESAMIFGSSSYAKSYGPME